MAVAGSTAIDRQLYAGDNQWFVLRSTLACLGKQILFQPLVETDANEFRRPVDRRTEPERVRNDRKSGDVQRGQSRQPFRRDRCGIYIGVVARQITQLPCGIHDGGLFCADRAISAEFHWWIPRTIGNVVS